MFKIKAIKTDVGYYLQEDRVQNRWNTNSGLENYIFDGAAVQKTFNPQWVKVDRKPKVVKKLKNKTYTNKRFELINPELVSDKIKLVIPFSNIETDGDFNWTGEYSSLQSLYCYKHDEEKSQYEEVDFELEVILECDQIKEYGGFSYPIQRTCWESEGYTNLTLDDLTHEELDTILFPDIILPARVSKLTNEQSYKIIRKYIQDNINPKYARITSDYDFCLSVSKRISLSEPEPYQKQINSLSAKKPKYKTEYRHERGLTFYEVAPKAYQKYPVVTPFVGKNIEELKESIDKFLEELINKINEPLKDCECCKGRGVVWNQ